jgi:cell division protease FtsH
MAGGMTMFLPKEDRSFESKKRMEDSLVHLLGGRVAEALVLDDISTGASNDIERATSIARNMVAKYGMSSKLGAVNYSDSDEVFLGKDFTSKKNYSEATAALIDEEVKNLRDNAYSMAEKLLKENMDKLVTVAETLLEVETLNAEQFEQLYTGEKTREEIANEIRTVESQKAEKIARQKEAAAKEDAELEKKLQNERKIHDELLKKMDSLKPDDIVFENRHSDDKKK